MTHKLKTTALKSEANVACVYVCGGGDLSCPASLPSVGMSGDSSADREGFWFG